MTSDTAVPADPGGLDADPAGGGLVGAARDLAPLLAAQAAEAENLGRLTDAAAAALRDGGFLPLFAPRLFGGPECDLRTAVAVLGELGRGCGAGAWVAALLSGASYLVSLFGEQARDDVWGADPRAAVCGGFSGPDTAERTADGLVVSGRWQPLSGVHQAQWALLGVPLVDAHGATVGRGMALVPIGDGRIEQTWCVAGMQATGSHTFVVDAAVVPDHRILPFHRVLAGADAGEHPRGSIYTAAPFTYLSVAMLGSLLGMADAALDVATEYLAGRSIGATIYARAVDSPTVRLGVADAARLIGTAHLHTDRAVTDLEAAVASGVRLDRAARARIRMDIGTAARAATDATRLLLDACGSGSFALSRPLQRIWRNLEVASRHPALAFDLGREIYANALLGIAEEITPLY